MKNVLKGGILFLKRFKVINLDKIKQSSLENRDEINYCKDNPKEILIKSKILISINQGILKGKGISGDCGNFATALNNRLCNRGLFIVLCDDTMSLCHHILLEYGNKWIDSEGIYNISENTKKRIKREYEQLVNEEERENWDFFEFKSL